MMNRMFLKALTAVSVILAAPLASAATTVNSIDFKVVDGRGELQISADGPIAFDKQDNNADNQIVLEMKDTRLGPSAKRKLDTSSFNSLVSLVSPYQVNGGSDARVVIQLREMAVVQVSKKGNSLQLSIPNSAGGDAESAESAESDDARVTSAAPGAPPSATGDGASASASGAQSDNDQVTSAEDVQGSVVNSARFNKPRTKLDQFIEARKEKRYIGRPINLNVRDAEIQDVFRLIGEASGFNIIMSDDVKGKITLQLTEVPWDQALDLILRTQSLGAERNHNVLRVSTLGVLTREKTLELQAQAASDATTPRVTRVFPISYAKLSELQTVLTRFGSVASPAQAALGGAGSTPSQTLIQADERTNSIIVRDTAENIEKMRKLIEILDTQTPQIVIEAKIVEASEGFATGVSGNLGLSSTGAAGAAFASFRGANPSDALIGNPGVFKDGKEIAAINQNVFGLGPTLSFLPGNTRLNAVLNIQESENRLKVVASPRTVVLNKETASIVQSTPVLVAGVTTVAGVGTVAADSVQQANLSLNVQPSVTNDGSVLMQLTLTRDVPQAVATGKDGIAHRNMSTKVLVESGSTLVIGGVYTARKQETSAGMPFLRKIPILGALFGQDTEQTDRSELFFFVTPRILNEKEAGIGT